MIEALAVLLLFQLVGEVLVQFTGVPVPGPVVGMMLLFAGLLARGSIPEYLRHTSLVLLRYLSLLFVPAGVGVMLYVDRIADEWLAILIALFFSTWLSIAVTVGVMTAMMRLTRRSEADHE